MTISYGLIQNQVTTLMESLKTIGEAKVIENIYKF